jgi:hypothetical protein
MRDQLGIPGKFVLEPSLNGRTGRQVHPTLTVQHGRNGSLSLLLDRIQLGRPRHHF